MLHNALYSIMYRHVFRTFLDEYNVLLEDGLKWPKHIQVNKTRRYCLCILCVCVQC